MSYINTPDPGLATTRQGAELRSAVDQARRVENLLEGLAERNLQIATDTELAVVYGYVDVQDATDMRSLIASASQELQEAPFFQQLIGRIG